MQEQVQEPEEVVQVQTVDIQVQEWEEVVDQVVDILEGEEEKVLKELG